MVHTRRMDSTGAMPDIGTRHRTRRTLEDAVDGESSSDIESEGSPGEDDSLWVSREKRKTPLRQAKKKPPARPKRLHSKFVYNNLKYTSHVSKGLRSSRKRISLDDRRTLTVYSSHKMLNDADMYHAQDSDEEDVYPHRSRRLRHASHIRTHLTRIQRRTALSLRPISQKSYADPHSPSHFNSDSEGAGVRRSKRQRKVQFDSWLADDQIHKVGYPNYTTGYSEEDSRDAPDISTRDDLEMSRRITRLANGVSKRRQILYGYETGYIPSRQRNSQSNLEQTDKNDRELRSRRESNDKDKINISNASVNTSIGLRSNGRLRSLKDLKQEIPDENSNDSTKSTENVENKEPEMKSVEVEVVVNGNGDVDKNQESSESDEDPVPKTRTRAKFTAPGGRKVSESSSSECELPSKLPSRKGYSLRDRVPKPPQPIETSVLRAERNFNARERRRRFTRRRRKSSSSCSDSSSDDDVRREKFSKTPKGSHSKNDQRMKSGAGGSKIIPIGPETLDTKVRFSSIGGLDSHIQCLKEMILLPMMYPEVFRQFQIQPPRGVLFHGPPGTGKTLIARALANECSFGTRKVSFFMRKGADLLSKWIGESEKQLRLLFAQAAEMKPSIIFFDELDGLAPVRSSRQDQVHASIVSTLLALMDGLDNRGEVIVIGATNRIDAIDPALRRPGRFDRELFFPLPARKEREEILNVHVSQWSQPPNPQLLSYLAENAVGYCGSDLRALCTEAVIQSFRRTYPQVYTSDHRLLLNPENVKVNKIDFLRAKSLLVPASQRISHGLGKKLLPMLEPLLKEPIKNVFSLLEQSFPHASSESLSKVKLSANVRPAQLLITADSPSHGQTKHLAPALLYQMEHLSAYPLDFSVMFQETSRSPEEACIQVFNEARRNIPSVIYMPTIDKLWNLMSETTKAVLVSQLNTIDAHVPLLLLATSDIAYCNLPADIQDIFSRYRREIYNLNPPNTEQRRAFFKPLIIDGCLQPPRPVRQRAKTPPPLPKAPTPPPSPLTEEQTKKLYEKEEHTLRELRIFLRDMCRKLANNKLFYMFTKPVDTEEVPDYTTIIKQPMDLETMMTKVDFHRYECAKDFLTDIELICNNALEYNPAKTSVDRQIRHRACSLRDYAYTLIKNEMDTDFEGKCQDIAKKRKTRKAPVSQYLPDYIKTPDTVHLTRMDSTQECQEQPQIAPGDVTVCRVSPNRKRKYSSWQRGFLRKRKRHSKQAESPQDNPTKASSGDESKENTPVANSSDRHIETSNVNNTSELVSNDSTATVTSNCDVASNQVDNSSHFQSPKRRLSDLLSPSELLDDHLDFDDVDQALNETAEGSPKSKKAVDCPVHELEKVLEQTVRLTVGYTLQSLLDLHSHLNRIIRRYHRTHLRSGLPKDLLKELSRFKKEASNESLSDSTAGIASDSL